MLNKNLRMISGREDVVGIAVQVPLVSWCIMNVNFLLVAKRQKFQFSVLFLIINSRITKDVGRYPSRRKEISYRMMVDGMGKEYTPAGPCRIISPK